MIVDVKDSYSILRDDRGDSKTFAAYLEFIVPQKFEEHHLVVDLLKYDTLELTGLLSFLKISTYHRASKHSFVMVNSSVDIDDIPTEMIVVPTLQEAFDIVEMEAIERDLGF